jgi:hypothetical protein
MKNQVYVYYYRNRPPGLFVQPDGFNPDTRQSWSPRKPVDTPMGKRAFLGIVEYDRPLSMDDIYRYELWPKSPVEWAKFQVWDDLRAGGSIRVYLDYATYMAENPDDKELDGDSTAIAVEILIESGIDISGLENDTGL